MRRDLDPATPPVVVTVGGSDSGAGAGVQADLKTLSAHRTYAATVIVAVTAQNTRGVQAMQEVPASLVSAQFDAVASDLRPRAVKTGFLPSAQIVRTVSDATERWNPAIRVIDPVLVSSTGSPIVEDQTVESYWRLLRQATLTTPNYREAARLTGIDVTDVSSLGQAASALAQLTATPVLVTGGHLGGRIAHDVLVTSRDTHILESPRVISGNVHGTGCSLASSITARLVHGAGLEDAVRGAKAWVARAIAGGAGWRIGSGQGPIDHFGWADQADEL